jgi:lysozyme
MDSKNYFNIAKDFIKRFEGLKLEAYLDSADIPTIGYGGTMYANGGKVKMKDVITLEQAEEMLLRTIKSIDIFLLNKVLVNLNDNQRASLISLIYNIGTGNFKFSTMLDKINKNDLEGAANEFERWKWSADKVVNGLIRRRQAEKELFLS